MYDDILGQNYNDEDIESELFTKEMHPSWCAVYCQIQLNDMVENGVMELDDGGEPPIIVTEKGERNCMRYFKEFMGRDEPNKEDIELGMAVLKNEGLW